MAIRPISWIYVEDLNISIRWVQGDHFQDILRGSWSVCRDLPVIERMSTNGTWVDDTDVYREANRYLKAKYEAWHAINGTLRPPLLANDRRVVPAARAPQPAVKRNIRSTDFVAR